MTIEQLWNAVFQQIQVFFEAALRPFVLLAKTFGYDVSFGRMWLLLVSLCFTGVTLAVLRDEIVLARRGRRAGGKVIGIDPGDESPDRPIIQFKDVLGRSQDFISNLGCNAATRTIGAPVDIIYDPLKPKRAREQGRPVARVLSLIFWLFLGLFPFVLFLFAPEMR
ncbi:MAG TPA: DUF3592 domain-containing protein [Beijerinckiaceae bacterium]|jgi:hypothetical protein|nr:DUF3592 domain-containing protein [Beijerinckiaceae bacterium]